MDSDLHIPPHDLDIERSILSGLIFVQDTDCFDMVQPEHFYRKAHQLIYSSCKSLYSKEKTLDINLLKSELGTKLEEVGGLHYLIEISNYPPCPNTEAYCKKLINLWKLRKIIEISHAGIKRSFQAIPDETDSVIDYMSQNLASIAMNVRESEWCKLDRIVMDCIDKCEDLQKRQGVTGVPTGFTLIDHYTAGLQPSDLILLAARPGCGKTSFAINASKNSGKKGFKNGFMSLEMARGQIGNRFLSTVGRVNSLKLRNGRLDQDDWEKMTLAADRLSPLPIWIDDAPRATHIEVTKKARQLKATEGLDVLWIDYLGFMDGDKGRGSKVYEIESITRSLKALAKELCIPIVLICQLNREVERRDNKRPVLSDLRDSGALEQDADIVIFLYNDAKYNEESPDKGTIEVEIAKQRNGPTARLKLHWDESITRFDNLEAE